MLLFLFLARQKTRVSELGDTVTLNLDTNTVVSEYDDLAMLPDEVVSSVDNVIFCITFYVGIIMVLHNFVN